MGKKPFKKRFKKMLTQKPRSAIVLLHTVTNKHNMRTKTLLLAAATVVAGLVSSQADTVYSQNVVGYINVTLAAHSFKLVANQLDLSPSNDVNSVLATGMVSGETLLYLWNGTGYKAFTFLSAVDANPGPAGWYDSSFNLSTNTLNIGQGAFLQNPGASPITATFVGTVRQGTNNTAVALGFNLYSIAYPVATNIDNFPATSGQDNYYHWNGTGYDRVLTFLNATDADPGPAGWYDSSFVLQSTNASYMPTVGESFFLQHFGSATNWTTVFKVQ
jgi:hypothetical protein